MRAQWLFPVKNICLTCVMIALAALLNVTFVHNAEAHKVNVFAYVEGEQVIVEGYFSGNVKAQNCHVEVFDTTGKKLLEGKTDVGGIFSFGLKELASFEGSLRIVLNAEMGHRGEYTLNKSELPCVSAKESTEPSRGERAAQVEPSPQPQPRQSAAQPGADAVTATRSSTKVSEDSSPSSLDEAALRKTLEAVLDQKLALIVRMLGNQERLMLEEKMRGPKITDVIGGIGWILGIAGIVAFFWSKIRRKTS